MNQITETHRSAMRAADQAVVARKAGDLPRAQELTRQALALEAAAARALAADIEAEPSRSVLFRSAATLALECGDWREAERLVSLALSGNPPGAIAEELRALQDQIKGQRSRAVPGANGAPQEPVPADVRERGDRTAEPP